MLFVVKQAFLKDKACKVFRNVIKGSCGGGGRLTPILSLLTCREPKEKETETSGQISIDTYRWTENTKKLKDIPNCSKAKSIYLNLWLIPTNQLIGFWPEHHENHYCVCCYIIDQLPYTQVNSWVFDLLSIGSSMISKSINQWMTWEKFSNTCWRIKQNKTKKKKK